PGSKIQQRKVRSSQADNEPTSDKEKYAFDQVERMHDLGRAEAVIDPVLAEQFHALQRGDRFERGRIDGRQIALLESHWYSSAWLRYGGGPDGGWMGGLDSRRGMSRRR